MVGGRKYREIVGFRCMKVDVCDDVDRIPSFCAAAFVLTANQSMFVVRDERQSKDQLAELLPAASVIGRPVSINLNYRTQRRSVAIRTRADINVVITHTRPSCSLLVVA